MEFTFENIYAKAEELHDNASPLEAYQEIRKVMEYPGNMHGKDAWERAWYLFGGIAGALGFEKLSQLAVRAGDFPHDPKVLYSLGYELIEAQLPMIAATPLNQAHLMDPDNEAILTELTMALENAGMYDVAYMNLISSPNVLLESYLCRYLTAFNGVMSGHIEEVRELLPSLTELPDDNFAFMRDRIHGFVRRADAVTGITSLDHQDLRGWHYVLTGGLLLHLSPYGFDKPMRGRYCYVHDSYALIREGLERVRAAIGTWGLQPESIIYYPNLECEILAHSLGQLTGWPLEAWTPSTELDRPVLLLCYDLRKTSSEFLEAVSQRSPQQMLWSHAHCWTEDFPFTGDFHTFMYQQCARPWSPGIAQGEEVTNVPDAEPESLEGAVGEILRAEITPNPVDDMESFLSFVQAIGHPEGEGTREKYFHGSPVRSSRFN